MKLTLVDLANSDSNLAYPTIGAEVVPHPFPTGLALGGDKYEGTHTRLLLKFDGHGDHDSPDGEGHPVMIEFYDGQVRVVVYADVNDENPTHVIPLEGARESARREE